MKRRQDFSETAIDREGADSLGLLCYNFFTCGGRISSGRKLAIIGGFPFSCLHFSRSRNSSISSDDNVSFIGRGTTTVAYKTGSKVIKFTRQKHQQIQKPYNNYFQT